MTFIQQRADVVAMCARQPARLAYSDPRLEFHSQRSSLSGGSRKRPWVERRPSESFQEHARPSQAQL